MSDEKSKYLDKFEVGDILVPDFEAVAEFTPSQDRQPYGPVTEFPLQAKIQRWGVELLWIHTPAYTGKILFRKADPTYRGRVQYHINKDESFYLLSGRCQVRIDVGDGELTEFELGPGRAFHIPRYARHSIIALTDCIFIEASTPHFEDRINVDLDYVTKEYLESDPTYTGEDEAGVEATQNRIDESSPELVSAVMKAIGAD